MSIQLKTILGIALIEGVLLIVIILTMMGFIRESNYEGLLKRASTTATLFAATTKDAVLSYDFASLESFVDEVLHNPDLVYARVVAPDGQPFAEAGDLSNLEDGRFVADRGIEHVDDDVFDTSADIAEGGVIFGRVEIGLHIGGVTKAIQAVTRWSAALATIEMALVALFSLILGSYLTGQLKNLRAAARSVAEGDFDIAIPVKGRDEIAEVSSAFNRMAANLKHTNEERSRYERQLKELNQTLEQRVRKRTEELQFKNDELQTAYESLKDTQAKLLQSEKMATVGVLAAGVAHEINNPIGFIMGNLATLREYVEIYHRIIDDYDACCRADSESERLSRLDALRRWMEAQGYDFIRDDVPGLLEDCAEGTERVRDIVLNLREFSHPAQAELSGPIDPNQCVVSTLKMLNNELKYKCRINTDLGELPAIQASPGQLNQVLLNMLVNAGHAIEDQGEIRVTTRREGDSIHIIIEDDGKGIAPQALPRLFDPFYTTKPVGQGTGLGLAISYGIIKDHGGEIAVDSEPGKGTRFTIRLPIGASDPAES
ncbi:HAMP domain-containing sensor histidine kinase [Imhoffiella purpurea]|uniref:histidine kinase n=1 Tax=Imhoffiella purpurea TaxID=1249627 RepID=W9V2R2_9GAMM|nr:ATP-binding protein [Imhoffiella purpurea]EXJ13788.1 Signal transduction histidine kinase [Imhoffiella purpurea]